MGVTATSSRSTDSNLKKMKSIIQATELIQMVNDKSLILIDASSGPNGKGKYIKKHLQGALHLDLDTDLSAIKENAKNGGRHPLPTPQEFTDMLSQKGIMPSDHIVIYDDNNGANAAARLWWMLRAVNHSKVQVLNGGIKIAEAMGFPVTSKVVNRNHSNYPAHAYMLPKVSIKEVEEAIASPNKLVIDVRAATRFRGEIEPIDKIAGHIPGAINIPLTENLDEKGHFKSSNDLRDFYKKRIESMDPKDIIVHCGSGVTACHTLLAFDYAGFKIPSLYVGSWSEWSRNNKPIATGE